MLLLDSRQILYCRNKRLIHEIVVFFFESFSILSLCFCAVSIWIPSHVCACVYRKSIDLYLSEMNSKIRMFLKHSHKCSLIYTFLDTLTHTKYGWVELANSAGQVKNTRAKDCFFWCKEMNECEIRLSVIERETRLKEEKNAKINEYIIIIGID